jgi:hypothetical protein
MPFTENPVSSGLYDPPDNATVVEDPVGSGLYRIDDIDMAENPIGSGIYMLWQNIRRRISRLWPLPALGQRAAQEAED